VDARAAVEAIFRIESPKLIAQLARVTRDVGIAEELAQDALVAALEHWPLEGVPANPGAWLATVAKRRAIDALRRDRRVERKHDELARDAGDARAIEPPDPDETLRDDMLRLVFTACHPVLPREQRVALALRVLGGLTTTEIARAFLASDETMAQRIVRAKRNLSDANVAFEVPRGDDVAARLSSVLEVVYLVFNEGYSATAGAEWTRPELCDDALRLGRMIAELMSSEPEVHGLVALMELQASRLHARRGPDGEPILLLDQDRARWDPLLVRRGLAELERAEALHGASGPYALQAAIAACHARAKTAGETDWVRIATLYGELARVQPSPIVELNRAVAVGMAHGPADALPIVDALVAGGALASYHLVPSVRADLLVKLGRIDEARVELGRAIELTDNAREREMLRARVEKL
jgi:RNA polymerase sigma factor (sigma-70 family)